MVDLVGILSQADIAGNYTEDWAGGDRHFVWSNRGGVTFPTHSPGVRWAPSSRLYGACSPAQEGNINVDRHHG